MNKTKIQYLDYTWNPIAMRCTPISDGCRSCWHLAMAKRLAANPTLRPVKRYAYEEGPPFLDKEELEAPLHLKKPSRIGVQFMGDLFHQAIPDGFLLDIFRMMLINPQHTYFLLTKRPERMSKFLSAGLISEADWIWLGVSIENQKTADERIPILLQIPAAHRWVSVEPMLGPVNLRGYSAVGAEKRSCKSNIERLDWTIVGGETDPKARPMHPDWVRSLRDQCQASGTAFFFKGWGEWTEIQPVADGDLGGDMRRGITTIVHAPGNPEGYFRKGDVWMSRIGKKKAGRLLDDRTWEEYP